MNNIPKVSQNTRTINNYWMVVVYYLLEPVLLLAITPL